MMLRSLLEGISLWLAVLMMLFVHPLYAEARPMEMEQPGQLYLIDDQNAWQQPALMFALALVMLNRRQTL